MQKQLNGLGVEFDIFHAIDGKRLSENDLKKYSKEAAIKEVGRELIHGEIAWALSHAKIWQSMIEKGDKEVLILEDDVILGEMLIKILDYRHKLPDDWEMINFSTDADLLPFGDPIYDIFRVAHLQRNRCSAYLINFNGAQKLLSHVYPIRFAADGLTGRTYITSLIHYGIYPKCAVLADFKSNIWEDPPESANIRQIK